MSLPFDGFKAAQTGLVDMGNISFYNNSSTPIFNVWELASYKASFSEIVLNVTWAQLQASQNSLDTSFVDSAIQQVNDFNSTYHTDIGIKLRVWGGYTAPTWVKEINGAPITVTGQNEVDPGSYAPQTIGRFWTADYVNAWQTLQGQLAAKYDGMAIIRGISQTAGANATDEPFVPLRTDAAVSKDPSDGTVNQIAQLQMGGYNDASEMLTLRAAIGDYYQWSTTPLDYTMNNFRLFDSGNELPYGNFTLAVLQQARNSARIVQAGNHAVGDPPYAPDSLVYGQLAQDAAVNPREVGNSFQTNAPIILGGYPGWQGAVANGVTWNAGNIELWDFPTDPTVPNGFLSFSPAQVQGLAAILSAGSPPPNAGAPDDGSALSFIAPGSVTGAPGHVAFTGTGAMLLASANPGVSYGVAVTSLNGGTLGIGGLTGFYSATSGTTLSFSGSLSVVNTLLANLTDTVAGGTDIVRIAATDSGGNIAVRDVGVQTAPPVAPPIVTPGLLTASQLFGFSGGTAWVVGQGQAAGLNVAGQLGDSGILVVAGVQSQLSLTGDLNLSGNTSLLAALSPNAYSTAGLTIGGALSVQTGSSTYFSGTLAAATISNNGGTIRGNGTLDATGSTSIANTGTIEAVADMTLGSQRLTVSDDLTGTGTLTIDAGATLVLGGQVQDQTITFADNTASQFANTVYSPSTLVLGKPGQLTGTTSIGGFTFADRLVLENVTLSTVGTPVSYDPGTNTLKVTQAGGATFSYKLTGDLTGLQAHGTQFGTSVVVTFAAPSTGIAPKVSAPDHLALAVGTPVYVPGVVLQAPLPSTAAPESTSFTVTVTANAGGKVAVEGVRFDSSISVSGTLGEVQTQLQTLMYSAGAGSNPHIDITIANSLWGSGSTSIAVDNSGTGTFQWTGAAGDNDFANGTNWNVGGATTPPGGINTAFFAPGNNTATGDGAVGQILNLGKTILTGNITAQGLGTSAAPLPAVVVDGGGALILTGGASLSAQHQVSVGATGQGLLTVAGGALALAGPTSASPAVDLVIGGASGSNGTVLNLELITATGQAIVGGAGTGTLELLGVASTMIDGGAVIGQAAGGHGGVIVNGGEWTNNGLLTVGDAGIGSLTINGMNRGITGQVTAWNAAIGNQATGQGTVTLDGGELLVANVFAPLSTLVVGNLGSGSLVLDNGSEVAVGAAQGSAGNNTGMLIVGGANGAGSGLVRIGAYSSLLVYGNAVIGDGAGAAQVIVGQGADEGAVFATSGTLAVGGNGEVTLGGAHATLRAAFIDVAEGGAISGAGTISGLGGGNKTVALTEIDNDGAITAEGGNLLLYGSVEGTGTLGIGANATLTLQAGVEAGQTLAFGNNSKAVLNDARAFHGTITGFGSDDVLDLAGIQATNPNYANGVLALDTPFGAIFLTISGPYAWNAFSVQSDGLGGTLVSGGFGDVHIVSLDGFAYEFQAVGEYVAARGSAGGTSWQVQILTDGQHGTASWTTGLAAQFGDTAVIFEVGKPITLHVDGAPDIVMKGDVAYALSGGTLTPLSADTWRVAWDSGEVITVSEHGISLDWQVSAHDPASVQGLLGPHSAPWSYVNLSDGPMVRQAWSNDQIVGAYADAWRVAHSLFEHHHSPL